jgi:hypothetical protein
MVGGGGWEGGVFVNAKITVDASDNSQLTL